MTTEPAALPGFDAAHLQLLDAIPHLVWVAGPDGGLEYVNRRCLEYAGVTLAQLRAWGWKDLIHPDDAARVAQSWMKAFRAGEDYLIEYRLRRADGAFRWFVVRGQPQRDAAGRVVRWFGTCSDIDDRKTAEAARRATEGLFRAIVERSYEGFALMAADRTVTYVSPAVTRILGYTPDELVGSDAWDWAHPDSRPGLSAWLAHLLSRPGERIEVCYRFRHRDGSYRRLEFRATNLLDDPDVRAVVANFWDVGGGRAAPADPAASPDPTI
ncbi:MAG: PAS domain-containing protein [Gemmataceae bacterium]|nr:PAS domain-containing protein [Gemmataceae bacterium]